jgi:DNA topoisomerase-1
MNLVIVESPTKAKTIQRFLPAGFTVKSSYGHVRDLPKKNLGVDTANNFEPKYVVPLLARKRLGEIKKVLPKAEKIILASDEDREGEAIAWHLTQALKIKPEETERIVFHEITKSAIAAALKNPRQIDMNLVNAQQARRILDRLVGYELSPFLWRKVAKGLSAGRVQSVAVRLIAEREREIQAFKPEEYWSIEALFGKKSSEEFSAQLIKKNGETVPKPGIKTQAEAEKIAADLKEANFEIAAIEKKDALRHPAPPFTTSTLQQEAANKLHFSAKQTMQIAQQLYEGVALGQEGEAGLITYMRTDSLNLASEAVTAAADYIAEKFGKEYLPDSQRLYKTKSKGAQEAHEAIRPTDINLEPGKIQSYLTPQQFKLYNLIWRRTLACQMADAVIDTLTVDVEAAKNKNVYIFRANGSQIKFDGFLKMYNGKIKENILPPLEEKEKLDLKKLMPDQHFTQPPARYSEASLIKALEAEGIGRPSTYAPTISTIQDRNYVQKNADRKFVPTEIGFIVNDLLVEHFPQIVDIKFTAHVEEDFDEIATGKIAWTEAIKEFYEPFKANLEKKYTQVKKQKKEPITTDEICPQCGANLLIRTSRFGQFYACSQYPKCRYTKNIADPKQNLDMPCPKCLAGEVVIKRTKRGKIFYGCSRWPECDFASWDKPNGQKCPLCGQPLTENKYGLKCSNKACDFKEKNIKTNLDDTA